MFSLQPSSTARKISQLPIFALAKFCHCEFWLLRNFAVANFRSDEISAKRNFPSVDAKFRQDDSEISFNSTKFRERFDEISSNCRENKERKAPNFVCISFAQCCIYIKLA